MEYMLKSVKKINLLGRTLREIIGLNAKDRITEAVQEDNLTLAAWAKSDQGTKSREETDVADDDSENMESDCPNKLALVLRSLEKRADEMEVAERAGALVVLNKEQLIAEIVKTFSSIFGGRAEDLSALQGIKPFTSRMLMLKRAKVSQHSR